MGFSEPTQSRESKLIIEWGKHSLSFSVFHEAGNRILHSKKLNAYFDAFDATQQDFTKLIKDIEWFAFQYQEVIILFDFSFFTLIPTKVFDKNKVDQWLPFVFNLPQQSLTYLYNDLALKEYVLNYAIPTALDNAMRETFTKVTYASSQAVLLNHYAKHYPLQHILLAHFSKDSFVLSYFNEQKLQFHNRFDYLSQEDILYYTITSFEKLNILPERAKLYYSGELKDFDRNYLTKYIQNVEAIDVPHRLNYNVLDKDYDAIEFLTHYAVVL